MIVAVLHLMSMDKIPVPKSSEIIYFKLVNMNTCIHISLYAEIYVGVYIIHTHIDIEKIHCLSYMSKPRY